ncbi:MAG: cyclic-di-AMP receptor, partial [Anaerolineales bacterium]|nr:cyclic-di-AMP receptor [Anaerolineales bacterium]
MDEKIDALVVAVIAGGQAGTLTTLLTDHGFTVTELASQASLVEQPMTTLLIGTCQARQAELVQLVRECCPQHVQYVPVRVEPAFSMPPLMVEALAG